MRHARASNHTAHARLVAWADGHARVPVARAVLELDPRILAKVKEDALVAWDQQKVSTEGATNTMKEFNGESPCT